jgi:hypothetical protein
MILVPPQASCDSASLCPLLPCLQATLGRARSSMVQWLLECLNPASSASMTRSKAIKALGEVVQVRI